MHIPRLMAVLAHPDDESLGAGGVIATYASKGVDVFLLTATRGDRGRTARADVEAVPEIVARIGRTVDAELRPTISERQ